MPQPIKERLRLQEQKSFVGRAEELAALLEAMAEDGPLVTFVYGLGGMGKSSLLAALLEVGRERGAGGIHLDCRAIQPSEQGLLEGLSRVLDQNFTSPAAIADYLGRQPGPLLLAFDTYEVFRLMDTWLRQVFVPALPDNVRLFFFGREAPVTAWLTAPGWQGLVRSMRLGPLDGQAAADLLAQAGVDPAAVGRISAFANGHPLALKLAAAALAEQPDLQLEELESRRVVEELASLYLKDARDPLTRQVLEAASVVRRATRSLLGAMLPGLEPQEAYDRLKALPFVETGSDGLIVHDVVRQTVETLLRATDPSQYRSYRRAAWQRLRNELATAGRSHLWRYTADMIYLIEYPIVREAFFPSDAHLYAVEQARPDDGTVINAITTQHDGPESVAVLSYWWRYLPESFTVVRDPAGQVVGYYQLFNPAKVSPRLLEADGLVWQWWQHLQDDPIPPNQGVLFSRRLLAADAGEDLSGVQAACWLDIKRAYLANPHLRRIYFSTRDTANRLPVVEQLGFRLAAGLRQELDGRNYSTLLNDFGPGLVFGWMANLVEAQYGQTEAGYHFDIEARELVLDGERVNLTPLEFGVLHCLYRRLGKAVSRADLLEEVWGYNYDGGGSNVVDSIIRSLRKKLGRQAGAIETVSGVGYRFRGFE